MTLTQIILIIWAATFVWLLISIWTLPASRGGEVGSKPARMEWIITGRHWKPGGQEARDAWRWN